MTTTLQIGTEKIGTRIYVTGNTYAIKDQLKSAGCHWDGERKQWWIGTAKADKIASIVGGLDGQEVKEDLGEKRVYAKVKYKGRTYFVIGESGDRCRLTVLDGSIEFWTDKAGCELLKQYQPRQVWNGRRGSNQTVAVYTTLKSIREFVEGQKKAEANGEPACPVCGKRGELHHDLEDGLMKCYGCCDMPE